LPDIRGLFYSLLRVSSCSSRLRGRKEKAEKSFSREENDYEAVKNIESRFDMFEKTLKEIFEDPTPRPGFDWPGIFFLAVHGLEFFWVPAGPV
jgi:hypothetical protein